MVLFNVSTKELTAKIVYYGPGLCGKTTNLQFVHQNLPDTVRGKMLSLATKTDRTLFFDFLPMDLGEIRGMKTRIQLYTVPGQVFYNETRKLVLKGADGVVFVADSQKEMLGANVESFKNLEENLKGHGLKLSEIPHVIQFNKRDLPNLSSIEELNAALNRCNAPFYEAVATSGIGVQDTLKAITKLVLLHLTKKAEHPESTSATASTTATVTAASKPPAPAAVAASSAGSSRSKKRGRDRGRDERTAPQQVTPLVTPSSPAPTPAMVASVDAELDRLVNEVEEAPAASRVAEPHVERAAPSHSLMASAPPHVVSVQAEAAPPAVPMVTLSEALDDQSLFADPCLEVAQLAPGDAREIVIPVEIGQEGVGLRRFKLSLRLRLDPVE